MSQHHAPLKTKLFSETFAPCSKKKIIRMACFNYTNSIVHSLNLQERKCKSRQKEYAKRMQLFENKYKIQSDVRAENCREGVNEVRKSGV